MLENRYLFAKFHSVIGRVTSSKLKVFILIPDIASGEEILSIASNLCKTFASVTLAVAATSCGGGNGPTPDGGNSTKVEKSFELTNKLSSIRFDRADSSLILTQTGVYSEFGANAMAILKVSASTNASGDVVSINSPIFNLDNILGLANGASTDTREVIQPNIKIGLTISADGYDLAQSTDGKYRISKGTFDDNASMYAKNVESVQQLREIFSNPNLKWKLQKNPDSSIKGIGTDNTTYLVGLVKHVDPI